MPKRAWPLVGWACAAATSDAGCPFLWRSGASGAEFVCAQTKGTLKDAAGKVQEAAGKVIGSHEQPLKGIKKQVVGQAQKAVGDIKEVVSDAAKK